MVLRQRREHGKGAEKGHESGNLHLLPQIFSSAISYLLNLNSSSIPIFSWQEPDSSLSCDRTQIKLLLIEYVHRTCTSFVCKPNTVTLFHQLLLLHSILDSFRLLLEHYIHYNSIIRPNQNHLRFEGRVKNKIKILFMYLFVHTKPFAIQDYYHLV